MKAPASIGVLLPTRNCAALLPGHLEAMTAWCDLAKEIVVVDSFSQDGTVEFLRANLRHPGLKFLSHAPGLYQSWNHGIQNLRSQYTYISTVGDAVTRPGVEHLRDVAEQLQCDVVISKPAFIDADGKALSAPAWPIDDIRESLQLKEPVALSGMGLFLFALLNCTRALLGSSASNLYRTACLQQRPFPTDFGTVGDGAWGIMNAFAVRLGVTLETGSTFRFHPKSYAASEYAVPELSDKLFRLACESLRQQLARQPELQTTVDRLRLREIIETVDKHLACQRQLERTRQLPWPWIFNPGAWLARWHRGRNDRRLRQLKRTAVALHFGTKGGVP